MARAIAAPIAGGKTVPVPEKALAGCCKISQQPVKKLFSFLLSRRWLADRVALEKSSAFLLTDM